MALSVKSSPIKYKRVLLKLTGSMFAGLTGKGLDFASFSRVATYLCDLHSRTGVELAIVLGAGNLFRGREVVDTTFDKATADYIGMLGTIMNALALGEELSRLSCSVRVLSSISVPDICEPFYRNRALKHLEKGRLVILAGGTGSPFFTTDSAAALKAAELKCEIILKGSNVEGVFDGDPKIKDSAKLYKSLTYQEALEKGLMVMDNTAFALCHREKIPIRVFNVEDLSNIEKTIAGLEVGTLIR